MKPVGGVIVYVIKPTESGRRVLFMKRSGGMHEGGWWPVAGTPKPPESAEETALRELFEETGLTPAELLDFDLEIPHVDPDKRLAVYVALVNGDVEVRLNYEHSAFQWLTGEQAINQVPPHSRRYLEHLNNRFIKTA